MWKFVFHVRGIPGHCNHSPKWGCRSARNVMEPLFSDFAGRETSGSANAIAFQFGDERVATILLAKSSERYRIQSDSLAALSAVLEELVHRLRDHCAKEPDFAVTCNSAMPIAAVSGCISDHFAARRIVNALHDELVQLSAQFRLIQRRLVAKYKIKNPVPLTNLEILMNDTIGEIMDVAEKLEKANVELSQRQSELSSALSIVASLVDLLDADSTVKDMLRSALEPHIYDLEGQNWEDVADAALCYLLRTALAKSEKDALRAAHQGFEEVKDVSKVQRHVAHVFERIAKGDIAEVRCEEGAEDEAKGDVEPPSAPIGSQIGEASLRCLSAKGGRLQRRKSKQNL